MRIPDDGETYALPTELGQVPLRSPLTSKEYEQAGIPWFDDYRGEGKPLAGELV